MINYRALFDLTGKHAVVTGGAGILGRHFCSALAAFGANVAVIDIDQNAADKLAAVLHQKYAVKSLGIGCDVSEAESVASMRRIVVEAFGEIHILHNNAATKSSSLEAFFTSFEDYSLEEWREVMSVNLDGMFLVSQEIGKQMVKQGTGGSIIHTASIYGIMAPDQRIYDGSWYMGRNINTPAVYSASKAGVVGLSKYLSTYWADAGIRVNTLTPGGVKSGQNDEFFKRYSNRVPLARMAEPSEMTGAVVFLASDASSYVTGQNIIVDGGLSVW